MKVALAQINTTVADFSGNLRRILEFHQQATQAGVDLVVYPELAVCGYPPLDLLLRRDFIDDCERALGELVPRLVGPAAVVGTVRRHRDDTGRRAHNSAAVIVDGVLEGFHDKVLLPTYDVFDEPRYFEPGGPCRSFEIAGVRIGIGICEDLWGGAQVFEQARYTRRPMAELVAAGARVVLSPSASPYHHAKPRLRDAIFCEDAELLGGPVVVCNLVGGNTELIFDGHSLVATPDGVVARADGFREQLLVVDLDEAGAAAAQPAARGAAPVSDEPGAEPPSAEPPSADRQSTDPQSTEQRRIEELADALVLGLRDYFRKCGFTRALIGMSGGIDSALTAAIACDALGAECVRGVAMPSRYSSAGSLTDARALAENLGMELAEISIEPLFVTGLASLEEVLGGTPRDLAAENLQARIRGLLLMAISNHAGELVLTTGNKSELAVGYCTLYGDMCGALAPIGDVAKTDAYRLSELPRYRDRIPESVRTKPPSAELRPDQTDQDSLPPYSTLDAILESWVEQRHGRDEIIADGHPPALVDDVIGKVQVSEYKRRQAAPTLRVTPKAFGIGRRLPIARRHGAATDPMLPGGGA